MSGPHLPAADGLGVSSLDTEVWVTRRPDGQLQPIRVDDMTPDHRAAVLRWIRTNATVLDRHERRLIVSLRRAGTLTLEDAAARIHALDQLDPHVWIEDTPLVRRLVQLVPTPTPPHPPRRRRMLPARLLGART